MKRIFRIFSIIVPQRILFFLPFLFALFVQIIDDPPLVGQVDGVCQGGISFYTRVSDTAQCPTLAIP
ncbi:hypothetical protein BDW72DRAFT_1203 [Aspergillus terricola var. indicus]